MRWALDSRDQLEKSIVNIADTNDAEELKVMQDWNGSFIRASLEMRGIDFRASYMLSKRFTTWATPTFIPVKNLK